MVDTYVVAVGDKLLHFSEGLVHESHVHDDLVQQCVALYISDNVKGTQKDRQKKEQKGRSFRMPLKTGGVCRLHDKPQCTVHRGEDSPPRAHVAPHRLKRSLPQGHLIGPLQRHVPHRHHHRLQRLQVGAGDVGYRLTGVQQSLDTVAQEAQRLLNGAQAPHQGLVALKQAQAQRQQSNEGVVPGAGAVVQASHRHRCPLREHDVGDN